MKFIPIILWRFFFPKDNGFPVLVASKLYTRLLFYMFKKYILGTILCQDTNARAMGQCQVQCIYLFWELPVFLEEIRWLQK